MLQGSDLRPPHAPGLAAMRGTASDRNLRTVSLAERGAGGLAGIRRAGGRLLVMW